MALNLAFVRRPPAEMNQGLELVLERIRAIPGVADVAAAPATPTSVGTDGPEPELAAMASESASVFQIATEGYHGLLGIAIRRGRDIAAADVEGTQRWP